MKTKKITYENFYLSTTANFMQIDKKELPNRQPDYVSKSGSEYWYQDDSVYRKSTHFNRKVASCSWFLENSSYQGREKVGVCSLIDFVSNHHELKVGKPNTIYYAPKARDGSENLQEFTDVFVKETNDYYIFQENRVSKYTFCAVALKPDKNGSPISKRGLYGRIEQKNKSLIEAKKEAEIQYNRMFKFAFEGKKNTYFEWKKMIESSGSAVTSKKRKAEYYSHFGLEFKPHFDKEVKEILK